MKVRLAGMVWVLKSTATPEFVARARKELTIMPRQAKGYGDDDGPPKPICCYVENAVEIGVPRAWWFQNTNMEHDYIIDVATGDGAHLPTILKQDGKHAEQGEVVRKFVDWFSGFDHADPRSTGIRMGAMLEAGTGFGKTASALAIASALGKKTLVIVHKDFLARQWVKRIQDFLPESRVGTVRGDACEIDGSDIVVGMIQSLSQAIESGRYPDELWKWPGLVIVDEAHRIGAATFSIVPRKFDAQYRIALTATPRRKDGAESVFWWHIGNVLHKAKTKMPAPGIRVLRRESGSSDPMFLKQESASPSTIVNMLAKVKSRNELILREIEKALSSPLKRKLFVLSERLEHLEHLESEVRVRCPDVTTSFYVGEWFAGGDKKPLTRRHWKLSDVEQFGEFVEELYLALRRRARRRGRVCMITDTPGGQESIQGHGLWEEQPGSWLLQDKKPASDAHVVSLEGDVVEGLGLGRFGAAQVLVSLESLSITSLFALAKVEAIRQKVVRKKRTLTEEELDLAERAQCIFATYQMVAEGVDVPALDTLILATPISDVEQAVGRIRRFCEPEPGKCERMCSWRAGECQGKKDLVVSDIADTGVPMASKRLGYRLRWYEKNGFKVSRQPG